MSARRETITASKEILLGDEITVQVLANSWMGPYFNLGEEGEGKERLETVGKPFALAYYYAGQMAEGMMPPDFLAKLHDFSKPDHGVPHLARVQQDSIVSADHNPGFRQLTAEQRWDAAMALMAAGAGHDHLENDAGLKRGHDHLGAPHTAMMMLLAGESGIPYSDSQIRLAADAVLHHSYRDSVDNPMLPVAEIIAQYDPVYSEKSQLWRYHKDKFALRNWRIEEFDFNLTDKETALIPFVRDRLFASDKRDSRLAPPFLTLVRTMATPHNGRNDAIKPFIEAEGLFKPLEYFLGQNYRDTKDVITRVIYELLMDLEAGGFNEFERGWTYDLDRKKLDYVSTIARDLATGDSPVIQFKFEEYLEKAKGYPLGCGSQKDLQRLITMERQATQTTFAAQSEQLRLDLAQSGKSGEEYNAWLALLMADVQARMKINGHHDYKDLVDLPIHNTTLLIPIYKRNESGAS